jgi:hypothetical protein
MFRLLAFRYDGTIDPARGYVKVRMAQSRRGARAREGRRTPLRRSGSRSARPRPTCTTMPRRVRRHVARTVCPQPLQRAFPWERGRLARIRKQAGRLRYSGALIEGFPPFDVRCWALGVRCSHHLSSALARGRPHRLADAQRQLCNQYPTNGIADQEISVPRSRRDACATPEAPIRRSTLGVRICPASTCRITVSTSHAWHTASRPKAEDAESGLGVPRGTARLWYGRGVSGGTRTADRAGR